MTRISARPRRTTSRISRGTTSMPPTSMTARKPSRRKVVRPRNPADTAPPLVTAVSTARSRMAIRSSATSTENATSLRRPRMPLSAKVLAIMVVLEMAQMAPTKMLSVLLQPSSLPEK